MPTGGYQLVTRGVERDGQHAYRPGHPLAEFLIHRAAGRKLDPAAVVFNYGAHPTKLSVVEALRGHRGYLSLTRVSIESLEREDHLVFAAVDDSGTALDQETCDKLFLVDGEISGTTSVPLQIGEQLAESCEAAKAVVLVAVADRNHHFFDQEIEKLERWAEDLKEGLEQELKELDAEIKGLKKQAKLQLDLEAKLALHRQAKEREAERSRKRRALYDAQDEIESKKESLISDVEAKLQQRITAEELFAIRWEVR